MSKYFSDSETECKCGCGGNYVTPTLMEGLDRLREAVGRPLYLSCAYRCPQHNADVGGVLNSQHTRGTAADVLCPEDMDMDEFLWYAETYSGADGLGYYPSDKFIHLDYRSDGDEPMAYRWEE